MWQEADTGNIVDSIAVALKISSCSVNICHDRCLELGGLRLYFPKGAVLPCSLRLVNHSPDELCAVS